MFRNQYRIKILLNKRKKSTQIKQKTISRLNPDQLLEPHGCHASPPMLIHAQKA